MARLARSSSLRRPAATLLLLALALLLALLLAPALAPRCFGRRSDDVDDGASPEAPE